MNNVLKAYQHRHIIFINEHTTVRNCPSCDMNCYITKNRMSGIQWFLHECQQEGCLTTDIRAILKERQ